MSDIKDNFIFANNSYNKDQKPLPSDWKATGDSRDTASGYQGQTYINENTKEIVIAHRGTEFDRELKKDLLTADRQIVGVESGISNSLPDQAKDASAYTKSVTDQYPGYKISHTGHSLGGYLAETSAATYNQKATTFDSPGSARSIGLINPNYDSKGNLTQVVSTPNLVNSGITGILGDKHSGKIINLQLLNPTSGATLSDFLVGSHGRDVFTKLMDGKSEADLQGIAAFSLAMPAAKQFDYVMGIDVHFSKWGIPLPIPFFGMVFDPLEFLPFIGATVLVNNIPRAQAGSEVLGILPQQLMLFLAKAPFGIPNDGEMFMGSATVLVEDAPFSYNYNPAMTCWDIGMPRPIRMGKKKIKLKTSFYLPTSVVLAVPKGMPVLVGGPPTVDMMALAMKLIGPLLGLLKKTKAFKKALEKGKDLFNKAKKAVIKAKDKLVAGGKKLATKAGKAAASAAKNAVDAIKCFFTGHPVDIVTGKVYTDNIDFSLPGVIPIVWEKTWYSSSSYNGTLGYGWHNPYDMALAIAEDDEGNRAVAVRLKDGRLKGFPALEVGESYYERTEKLELIRDEYCYYLVEDKRLIYRFNRKHPEDNDLCLLTSIEDKNGFTLKIEYNQEGVIYKMIDTTGRVLDFITDDLGRITQIILPHPTNQNERFSVVSYFYDDNGNMIESRDALGQSIFYQYDGHLLVKETNKVGLNFHFEYDGNDEFAKCKRTWGDNGIFNHKLQYFEGYTIVEDSLGNKKTYYHQDGLVYKIVDSVGAVTLETRNEYEELIAKTEPNGETTLFQYDEWGNCTNITDAAGASLQIAYNELNLPIQERDPMGGMTAWEYDEKGNMLLRKDPMGQETTYKYINGWLAEVKNPVGATSVLGYDPQGNVNMLITADGQTYWAAYDNLGRNVQNTDPKGNSISRKLDLLGRVVESYEPDGNTRTFKYDGEDNVIHAKDQQHEVYFGYRGMNKLAYRSEGNTRVEFQYDTEDRLTGIINENRHIYSFVLDHNGEVTEEHGFDGLKRAYKRDIGGRVVEVSRPNNQRTNYQYDSVGRVTEVLYNGKDKERYGYRPDGLLVEAVNDSIAVKLERDLMGRIVKDSQGGYEVSSEYDILGNRIGVQSSLGANLNFKRNFMGDVEEVQGNEDWFARFRRDNVGLEVEREYKGGLRSTWQRDRLGRPTQQTTMTGGGSVSRSRQYKWDVNDRLKEISDSLRGTTRFEHDVFGNLAWAQNADGSTDFRMPDAVGNIFRTQERNDRRYGLAGQLLQAGSTRYEYDSEGFLTRKIMGNGKKWQYEWNVAGLLARVTRPDGQVVAMEYDALGRRISKSFIGSTTRWVWDGNTPLHEWIEPSEDKIRPVRADLPLSQGNNSSINRPIGIANENIASNSIGTNAGTPYVSLPFGEGQGGAFPLGRSGGASVTTWLFEPDTFVPLAKQIGTTTYSIIPDHLGTPLTMHDAAGQTVWAADLNIYGERKSTYGKPEDCPFRYQGQYEDVEIGLYYNRFRYYDPEGGNYISQDPIGLAGGNPTLYGYVSDVNIELDMYGLHCSKKLANDMTKNGIVRPNDTAAHHIVGSGKGAKPAKDILGRHDIDIDSHTNGVFLPNSTSSTAPGHLHLGRHNDDYIQAVNRDIIAADNAGGKPAVEAALKNIREGLLDKSYAPLHK
jgi:RHS repeat-associated protein